MRVCVYTLFLFNGVKMVPCGILWSSKWAIAHTISWQDKIHIYFICFSAFVCYKNSMVLLCANSKSESIPQSNKAADRKHWRRVCVYIMRSWCGNMCVMRMLLKFYSKILGSEALNHIPYSLYANDFQYFVWLKLLLLLLYAIFRCRHMIALFFLLFVYLLAKFFGYQMLPHVLLCLSMYSNNVNVVLSWHLTLAC